MGTISPDPCAPNSVAVPQPERTLLRILMIVCPVTGVATPSGRELSALPDVGSASQMLIDCLECGQDHEWRVDDAFWSDRAPGEESRPQNAQVRISMRGLQAMTDRDSSHGALTGATGSLTPEELEQPFVPAERREVMHSAAVPDPDPPAHEETIVGDEIISYDEQP